MNIPTSRVFGGMLKTLTAAPRGFYYELQGLYKGPFQTEQDARDALGRATQGPDGSVHADGAVVWWKGKEG